MILLQFHYKIYVAVNESLFCTAIDNLIRKFINIDKGIIELLSNIKLPNNNKQLSVNENNSNSISKNQSLATNNKLQKKSNQKDNNQLFVNSLNSISENQNLVTNDKTQNKSK